MNAPDTPGRAPVRFDEARPRALDLARSTANEGFDVLLVRDVLGRFTLIVDDRRRPVGEETRERWHTALTGRLGAYVTSQPLTLASTMFAPDTLLTSPRAVPDALRPPGGEGRVRLLDNTVVGEDWAKVSTPDDEPSGARPYRTAMYGFKGGVGRTTAIAMLARHLADQGLVVLVVDLDLESPGVGALLLTDDRLPVYGLVDHLVESAVSDPGCLDLVANSNYQARNGLGELWVAPARGRGGNDVPYRYVDKLNRVYADIPGASFADRLRRSVEACEEAVSRRDSERRPDVVLLDSRAGIHDVAAVTISRLCDVALLFGADNSQTWAGYRDLFTAWQSSGQAERIRERLKMVASMVPDSAHHSMDAYLQSFRGHAFEHFSGTLYDELPADATVSSDVFAPSEKDSTAPHYAIPILFEPGLVSMDALKSPSWQDRAFVQAAYSDFLRAATPLVTNGRVGAVASGDEGAAS
ncbi:KGGVGR-motif variant AAA ATPase [Streptomyces xiamenensis]|uniref:KGGVGR-motif variant AAA ATPase n=1 Tax=Streptomyces xiamenensis TaxID=408015 RepID=UPI0036B5A074